MCFVDLNYAMGKHYIIKASNKMSVDIMGPNIYIYIYSSNLKYIETLNFIPDRHCLINPKKWKAVKGGKRGSTAFII